MINFINKTYAHSGEAVNATNYQGSDMMGGFGMGLNWVFVFLFWTLIILAVVALVKYIANGSQSGNNKSKSVFVCAECGYEYEDKEWAIKCQNWCQKNKSCNLDIIKHGKAGQN